MFPLFGEDGGNGAPPGTLGPRRRPLASPCRFVSRWCGCSVSIGRGDLDTAGNSIARLKDLAEKHGLGGYYASGLGFEGQLAARRGDFAAGEGLPPPTLH